MITIAALAVAQYVGMRRVIETQAVNRRLAEENAKLRAEAGYLQVDDPSKVSVLRIRNPGELTWQWNVYLPKGKWNVSQLTEGIPTVGVPNAPASFPLDGGREVIVTVTVDKAPKGAWRCRTIVGLSELRIPMDESHRLLESYVGRPSGVSSSKIAGNGVQKTFNSKETLVLIRLRSHEVAHDASGKSYTKDNPQSSDGIMVWLEPLP